MWEARPCGTESATISIAVADTPSAIGLKPSILRRRATKNQRSFAVFLRHPRRWFRALLTCGLSSLYVRHPVHRGASSRGDVKVGRDAAPASVTPHTSRPRAAAGSPPVALRLRAGPTEPLKA